MYQIDNFLSHQDRSSFCIGVQATERFTRF